MANRYTVHTSLNPAVQITVGQAEFDRLTEVGLLNSPGGLDAVVAETDQIVLGTSYPPSPATGTVFVNTSVSP